MATATAQILETLERVETKVDHIDGRLTNVERREERRLAIEEYKKSQMSKAYPPLWSTKEGKALIGSMTAIGLALASYITIKGGL